MDDEPLPLRAAEQVLTRAGFEVATHQGGFGLSQAVTEHHPDVLVLDLSMPGLPGDWAFRAYRSLGEPWFRDLPVIVLSGLTGAEIAPRAEAIGAAAWLQKPALDELAATVKRVLAEHEIRNCTQATFDAK